jgi:hypothetical protein
MTYNKALAIAESISRDNDCGQHVNFRLTSIVDGDEGIVKGTFYVSDWFDCDSTVASFDSGKRTNTYE